MESRPSSKGFIEGKRPNQAALFASHFTKTLENEQDESQLSEALAHSLETVDDIRLTSFHEKTPLIHPDLVNCTFIKASETKILLWKTETTRDPWNHKLYKSYGYSYDQVNGNIHGPFQFTNQITFRVGSTFGNHEATEKDDFAIRDMHSTNNHLIIAGGAYERDCSVYVYNLSTKHLSTPFANDGIPTTHLTPLWKNYFLIGRPEDHSLVATLDTVIAKIDAARCFTASAEYWFALSTFGQKIKIFQFISDYEVQCQKEWQAPYPVAYCAALDENRLATCSENESGTLATISIWDVRNGSPLCELSSPSKHLIGGFTALPNGWLCINEKVVAYLGFKITYQTTVLNTETKSIEVTLEGSQSTVSQDDELIILNRNKIQFFDVAISKREKTQAKAYLGFSTSPKHKLFQLYNLLKKNAHHINLSSLRLSDSDLLTILPLLRYNKTFTSLDVSNNPFISPDSRNKPTPSQSAKHLADLYSYNTTITTLTMQNCRIENLGFGYFAEEAKHLALKKLDVSFNMLNFDRESLEESYKSFPSSHEMEIDISQNYLHETCDELFKEIEEKEFSEKSKYPLFQFHLFKTRAAPKTSIIKPDCQITPDQWLVCLACPKTVEHAFILLEGMRPNGQLFLTKYDLQTSEVKGIAKVCIQDWDPYTHSNDQHYFQAQSITADSGKILRQSIKVDELVRFDFLSKNCLHWVEKKLKGINVEFDKTLLPLPSHRASGKSGCTIQ